MTPLKDLDSYNIGWSAFRLCPGICPSYKMNAFCTSEDFDAFIVLHSVQPRNADAENPYPKMTQFAGSRSAKVNWHFSTDQVHNKLRSLYPLFQG